MSKGTLRKIRAKTVTWSTLAPGQIIAQPTIRPIVSQGGYHQKGCKQAIIWANNEKLSGTFEIIEVTSYSKVYQGNLKDEGRHIWGGNNLIADFTDFFEVGRYRVRLHLNETNEVVDSITFPIKSSLYFDLAKKGMEWFYYQRCGTEIPGWHPACHTDDGLLNGKPYDATGGWHDGGDYNKWSHYAHNGLFALTALYEDHQEQWKQELGKLPQPLDECVWEAEYLCKIQQEDGTLLSAIGRGEDPWFWEGVPENEPTRILSSSYGGESYALTTLVGAAIAKLARILATLGYDKAAVTRYVEVAKRGWKRTSAMDFDRANEKAQREYLETQGGLLLADLELYQLTHDQIYKKDAEKRVDNILAAQDEAGFFYSDYKRGTPNYGAGYHLVALHDFAKQNPQGSRSAVIKDAFAKWAAFAVPLTKLSNFGQMGGIAEDGSKRNLHRGTSNIYIASAGWALATTAMLLKRRDYLEIAERQLQWIVGYNPTEVSMMAGIGQGPGCYHTRMTSCEGHEDGAIPGGILNGIRGGDGTTFDVGDVRTNNLVVSDNLPVDYPIIDTDTYGWTYAYLPNEYWVPNSGWFVLAATQVEKAMRSLFT